MKKAKYTFYIIFLILPGLMLAQDSARRIGFYIGPVFSPDYSYRLLSAGSGPQDQLIIDNRNGYETPKLACTAGLTILYQKNKKLAFSFGIQYSVKGEATKDMPLNFGSIIDPRRGFVYTSGSSNANIVSVSLAYQTCYLDLPLLVNYYFSTGRNAWYVSGGISTNIFLYEKIIRTERDDKGATLRSSQIYSRNQTDYYLLNPQLQLGIGFDRIIRTSRLRIEPVGRLSVWNVDEQGTIKGYFYSVGISCQYFFPLKR